MTRTKQHPGNAPMPAKQQRKAATLSHHSDLAAHNLYLALPESQNSRVATTGDSTEQAAMTAAVRYIRSKTSQPIRPTIPTAPLLDRPPDEPCSQVVEELRDITPGWAVAAVKGTKGLQGDGAREKLEVMVAARLYIIALVHGTDGNGLAVQDALNGDKKSKSQKRKQKKKQKKKNAEEEAAEAAKAAEQLQHELAAEEAGAMEVHVTVDREVVMEDVGEVEEQFLKDDTGAESCGDDWEVDYGT